MFEEAFINRKLTMKIAYIIFDGITRIDLIEVYDPISQLKTLGSIYLKNRPGEKLKSKSESK